MSLHRAYLKTFVTAGIEFGPIVGFFISLYLRGDTRHGFLGATGLFVWLTAIALTIGILIERRVAFFPLLAGAFVIVFGVGALYVRDPIVFIVKDTIYNGLFGLLLFVGVVRGKGYLKSLFSSLFDMNDRGWFILSRRWMIMFFLLAIGNEIVWRNFHRDSWVMYKLCATVATAIFGFYQITLAKRERNPNASKWGLRNHHGVEAVPSAPVTLHQKVAAILLVALLALGGYGVYRTHPQLPSGFERATFGKVSLNIEFATTTATREKGLGDRTSIPEDYGMLFVFPHPDYYGFWMKDTLIPLDMFWLDDKGQVISIKQNALPESYPEGFYPSGPATYVLETNAGFAALHAIATGTPLLLKNWPTVSE